MTLAPPLDYHKEARHALCGLCSQVCALRSAVCDLRSSVSALLSSLCGVRSALCGLRSAVCGIRFVSFGFAFSGLELQGGYRASLEHQVGLLGKFGTSVGVTAQMGSGFRVFLFQSMTALVLDTVLNPHWVVSSSSQASSVGFSSWELAIYFGQPYP